MRTFSIFIVFISISLCFSACKKDEGPTDTGEDLTLSLVGEYVGQLTDGIGGAFGSDHRVTVAKVDKTTVSVGPTAGSDSRSWEQKIMKADNFIVNERYVNELDASITLTFTLNAIQYSNDGEFYNGDKQ